MNNKKQSRVVEKEREIVSEYVKIRKNAKVSQVKLAEETKVIRTTIARVESNYSSPQLSTILELLEPLGYTLEIVPIKK